MKTLTLLIPENIDHIVTPSDFEKTTLDSPATAIFTDFKRFNPLVIEESTRAIDALQLMMKAHVHLKIVISEDNEFIGIINSLDVSEQRIMHEVSLGAVREEILVSDVMVPREKLMAFEMSELEKATVNDVVNALKENGLRHCLVMDAKNHHIRGIISSSDIARKLNIPIAITSNVTFAKIFNAIYAQSY